MLLIRMKKNTVPRNGKYLVPSGPMLATATSLRTNSTRSSIRL